MTQTSLPPALADLLTVENLSDITPQRVQDWQAAVRALSAPTPTAAPRPFSARTGPSSSVTSGAAVSTPTPEPPV